MRRVLRAQLTADTAIFDAGLYPSSSLGTELALVKLLDEAGNRAPKRRCEEPSSRAGCRTRSGTDAPLELVPSSTNGEPKLVAVVQEQVRRMGIPASTTVSMRRIFLTPSSASTQR